MGNVSRHIEAWDLAWSEAEEEGRPYLRCDEDPAEKEMMGNRAAWGPWDCESRTTAERGEAGALGEGLADWGDYLDPVRMG